MHFVANNLEIQGSEKHHNGRLFKVSCTKIEPKPLATMRRDASWALCLELAQRQQWHPPVSIQCFQAGKTFSHTPQALETRQPCTKVPNENSIVFNTVVPLLQENFCIFFYINRT